MGQFTVQPSESFNSYQRYVLDTNVLQTTFRTANGKIRITDFMPISGSERGPPISKREICRRIKVEEGRSDVQVKFAPSFDYALENPTFERRENGITAIGNSLKISCIGISPDRVTEDGALDTVALSTGEEKWLTLSFDDQFESTSEPESALNETIQYWRQWVHNCDDPEKYNLRGPWHDYAVRSGLVLKLLTHQSTGAICAAPTTSLPEEIGGSRNWDYRYNWLRDTAFTTQALYKLGHEREALEYLDWLIELCQTVPPNALQPLYGLHGDSDLVERELPHLEGYQHSQPVRIGNDAHGQLQLDIYGELLDAIYETTRYGKDIPEQAWDSLREIVDYTCEVCDRPDSGIWEVRSEPQNFVYSKVMCWVALDRGIRLQQNTDFSGDIERWEKEKNRLRQTILTKGYNESLGSFVRSFESENTLDATNLLIAHRGFIPFSDERMQGTIDLILKRLTTDEGFVYRYEGEEGVPGQDGAFLLCSFWLINALILSGRTEEATKIFKKVIKHVSPLGLLAEEIDPDTKRQLGNFPQAFSHIGLINSAVYLTHAAGIEHSGPEPLGVDMAETGTIGRD